MEYNGKGINMDLRLFDKDCLTICPQCGIHYRPKLEKSKDDTRPIQVIFPYAKPWEREQLLTGICSNGCWKKYLSVH